MPVLFAFYKNVAVLQDRGHVVFFAPGTAEVHAQAGKWFDDAEIYGWFAANLHRVREPSLRHYVRARELKAAGMDWTEILAEVDDNRRARLAAKLLASEAYSSIEARAAAFVAQGEDAGRRFTTTAAGLGDQGQAGRDRRPLMYRDLYCERECLRHFSFPGT